MADPELLENGCDYFPLGMDSFSLPDQLSDNEYVCGMNLLNKGGLPKCRPGTASILEVPAGNYLQGLTFFKPTTGTQQLIFAVNGYIYVSNYPFTTYALMPGVKFSAVSSDIAWTTCLQSTDYDNAGNLIYLPSPYSVLLMQDGVTRAAVWDGSTGRHLNPTYSGMPGGVTVVGYDETPIGLWMCWSNNRLWLSTGNKVRASDIGNPTKFTESQYIAEATAFYLPDICTGMVESADHQGMWAFTETTGSYFQTSVQDRTLWESTLNFQQTLLKTVGCVAPRSIVTQYGMLWWYSARGLISMDDALRMNISSRLDAADNEMYCVKYYMSRDLYGIAGCSFENILVESVPYGDRYNAATMVLDQAPFEQNASAWPSYWTGWRPVEWCTGVINGQERVFFASLDFDGNNRIWEANLEEKTDNGVPITCMLQTKEHNFGNRNWKQFKYAEIRLMEIKGHASLLVCVAGVRGAFQPILTKEIDADQGQIYPASLYGFGQAQFSGSRPQTRVVRTIDMPPIDPANAAVVEDEAHSDLTDKAFSLLIIWSGDMALRAYRMFAYIVPQGHEGICEKDEEPIRLLADDGSGSNTLFVTQSPFTEYMSDFTFTKHNPVTALPVSHTAHATSIISQMDADIKAEAMATNYVLRLIGQI